MSTMVYPRDEALEWLMQDEIVLKINAVMQDLETLREEHAQLINTILDCSQPAGVLEKSRLLRKSLEDIELGLGEAQQLVVNFCLEEEKKHLEFINQIHKLDKDTSPFEEKAGEKEKDQGTGIRISMKKRLTC